MRPLASSVLSTVVVAVLLVASACTSAATTNADAPEAAQASPTQATPTQSDRGVAADPLPIATPTVTPEQPTRRGYPSIWLVPAIGRTPDITAVDLSSPSAPQTVGGPLPSGAAVIRARSSTPDGTHIWVPMPNPDTTQSPSRCSTNPTWILGAAALDNPGAPRAASRPGEYLEQATAVYVGPQNHVVVYGVCDGAERPIAIAKTTSDGELVDVRLLDAIFDGTVAVYPPRWGWGVPVPDEDPYDDAGTLTLVIPQLGMTDRSGVEGPAEVFVDVASVAILDVWANSDVLQSSNYYGDRITSDGSDLSRPLFTRPSAALDDWSGPVRVLRAQPWEVAGPPKVLVGGPQGAILISDATLPATDDLTVERLTARSITAAAWAPLDGAFALTGPDGTTLHRYGELVELSTMTGDVVFFTPDGASLVVGGAQGYQRYDFDRIEPPDLPHQITPFSSFDSGGLGPIRIGSTVSEVEELLGASIELRGIDNVQAGDCVWIHSPHFSGFSMLGEATNDTDAVITSLTVWTGPWQTPSGLRVGSTEAEVLATLDPQIESLGHKYTAGKYLDFSPADSSDPNGVRFETNGHEVVSISVGRPDWISLVEGCA